MSEVVVQLVGGLLDEILEEAKHPPPVVRFTSDSGDDLVLQFGDDGSLTVCLCTDSDHLSASFRWTRWYNLRLWARQAGKVGFRQWVKELTAWRRDEEKGKCRK